MALAHNLTPAQLDAADRYSRALAGSRLSPALRAECAKLDDAGIAELLGELLDMSVASPFQHMGDALLDALLPVAKVYRDAYGDIAAAVEPGNESAGYWRDAASADFQRVWERRS